MPFNINTLIIRFCGKSCDINYFEISILGNFIASSSEDGSLRFWDAFSGAEIVTVTGLPGPRYPALAGSYNGERPCVWDRTGKQIITGSEDGGVQAWDTNGAQVIIKYF